MSGSIDVRKLPGAKEVTLVRDAGYFPVLALLGEREVVAVLRGGAGHLGLAGRLELVRSHDGGLTWLPPAIIADSEWDDRNPAVGVALDGTLIVAYHRQGSYDEKGEFEPRLARAETMVTRSCDGGHSWERPYMLDFVALRGRSPYGRMLTFPEGTLGMCVYGEVMGADHPSEGPKAASYLLRSKDSGQTWGDPSLVAEGFNETAFLRLPDGMILAGLRTDGRTARIAVSCSSDDGRTWSTPVLATEPSEHPADLALLSNGWVLLTYGYRRDPPGAQGMVSRDRGKTWDRRRRLIYNDDRPGGDCGYPSTVRFPDGMLLTAYYSAGDEYMDRDFYRVDGAFAAGVLYSEAELIAALG